MTRALKAWPITAGLLVDLSGSAVFAIGYAIVKGGLQGAAAGDNANDLMGASMDLVVAAVVGLLLVSLGGYVAARMARVRPVAHGMCVGFGTLVVTLILESLVPDPSTPLWFTTVSIAGVVPAGSLGGHLGGRKLANKPLQPTSGTETSS